jgi:hypothetical protein
MVLALRGLGGSSGAVPGLDESPVMLAMENHPLPLTASDLLIHGLVVM